MKSLKCFLFGSAVAILFVSVIDKLVELILLWIEVLKIKPTERIFKHKKDMVVIKQFLEPVCKVYDDMDEDDEE